MIQKLEQEQELDVWSSVLYEIAAESIGARWCRGVTVQATALEPHELALIKWCIEAYPRLGVSKSFTSRLIEMDTSLMRRLGTASYHPADVPRAVLVHLALRRAVSKYIESEVSRAWQTGRDERDATKLVIELCRRFPLFAKHIQHRRKDGGAARPTLAFNDEYDVQDAMHAILHLHFDDVRPEEWTPSYAGTHSRMDFLLKSQKLVVEVKMTRKGLDQKEIGRQLAVDKEYYRAHEDCRNLVCFVFDPAGICTNPAALESDASESSERLKTVVIVAPKGL